MLKFIKKSPFGFVFAAAALVLAASPEAREEARKILVKGSAAVLNFIDQVKTTSNSTSKNPPVLETLPKEVKENTPPTEPIT